MEKSINSIYVLDIKWISKPEIFSFWYGKMSEERKKKIDAFRFEKDKRLSLGAGILLRHGLYRRGIYSFQLRYGEHGKPFLTEHEGIHFNLSHSENLVVCAFSDNPVGIDIEKTKHFGESLKHYVYQEEEIAWIQNNYEEPDRGFTELWTIKESFMKCIGSGLELNPRNISIDFHKTISVKCRGVLCDSFFFSRYDLGDYPLTVCSEYPDFTDGPERIELFDLF